jgi:hypothetical protein
VVKSLTGEDHKITIVVGGPVGEFKFKLGFSKFAGEERKRKLAEYLAREKAKQNKRNANPDLVI